MPEKAPLVMFGNRLRKIRSDRNVSQEALALKADLDRTYISGVERGIRNISLKNIYKLANALEITPVLFFQENLSRDDYDQY